MQVEFRLPSLGADMESATLTQWLKKPGDSVRRGEAIAVVETEKGLIDIESYDDAAVTSLVVTPGAKITVGTVMAHLTVEGAAAAPAHVPVGQPAASAAAPPTPAAAPQPAAVPAAAAPPAAGRLRLSPAARRRAHELGLSPEVLEQQADAGVVHVEDVERLAAAARATAAPAEARSAMRSVIGSAMARAKREIPHYYLGHTVDFGAARAWLQRYNAARPVQERLVEGLLVTKAVALAAAHVEGFNGYFRDGRFERAGAVHVGTAIALRGGGLVAPALLDADRKDLRTLMHEFSNLVARVRAGHMRSSEFAAATITVTSLGEDGVETLYPIINPPQVAIVGTGRVAERPWVYQGVVSIRPLLAVTLAADHRVTDGRIGSRFLQAIAELLAAPERL
ncbi:MAG TPA: dihydrolipoamide acetyltransferase family protein [Steroidobacteraceae bacterium]|nr:dihydrolipoamide acetyltransferase family protein [Steroidobacteraceae bacterium]